VNDMPFDASALGNKRLVVEVHRSGSTRITVCFGPWAFKFARSTVGMRCNQYENKLWHRVDDRRRDMLCPVLCGLPGNVLIIMKRARPLTEGEAEHLRETDGFPDWDYDPDEGLSEPFEYKATDWGWLEGHLVALDYSSPALFDVANRSDRSGNCR
jgi:hypothetical protein